MRKLGIIVTIIWVCVSLPVVPAMAQKTGKIEKLLAYLVANDTEKFQKNREKLDEETLKGFPDEMGLVDAINDLWNGKKAEAAPRYITCYEQAMKKSFPAICAKEKVEIDKVRARTDEAIVALLAASPERLSLSKKTIDAAVQTKYPMGKDALATVYTIREEALLADIIRQPQAEQCDVYLQEFPEGKLLHQVMSRYNELLFHSARSGATLEAFRQYFDNKHINTFFEHPDNRKFMREARSLYDDHLYRSILTSQELAALKKGITEYRTTGYLKDTDRKYIAQLEYKADSVDYELLKEQVKTADDLKLVKDYLLNHRFKEFRDKAQALRTPFEEQVVWTTPTYMRSYSRGLLMKSNEVSKDKSISTTYTYSDKGEVGSAVSVMNEKNQETTLQTNYFFDVHGHCVLEVQTNQQNKKEIYRRSRQITPAGEILSDSLRYDDGRLLLSSYDKSGQLLDEKEYLKDRLMKSVSHQYDKLGRRVKSNYSFTMPDTPQPTHVISQTETCEYNVFGYPSRQYFEKVLANNDKMQGIRTFLYDDLGNQIDSNAYYEYDHTGRWIQKTDCNHPSVVEYVQCTYR